MKKILTLFFACALSMAMQAQTKHNVYVWVDGEKTLIENADSITFSEPTTPPAGDEEAVDLGLSVKWAQRNLGAENPWDFGTYFAWGEIEGKDNYEWATYKHGTSYNQLTKYVSSVGYGLDGFIDNKEVLDESDDAARTVARQRMAHADPRGDAGAHRRLHLGGGLRHGRGRSESDRPQWQ